MCDEPFSRRHHYVPDAAEITIREDAPESLRVAVLEVARALDSWPPSRIRRVLCGVLLRRPDPGNWSEYPNVWEEVQNLLYDDCPWYTVYDFIERIHRDMAPDEQQRFGTEIDACFRAEGIGWQLTPEGQIVTRGTEAFEAAMADARQALNEANRPTAAGHVDDALRALSQRPRADLAGAIYHSMGALEAVARDITGDDRPTLGEVLRRNPQLLPRPLDTALSQIWGYTSNEARHVREGQDPQREEAELIVGLAAALATYLTRKQR